MAGWAKSSNTDRPYLQAVFQPLKDRSDAVWENFRASMLVGTFLQSDHKTVSAHRASLGNSQVRPDFIPAEKAQIDHRMGRLPMSTLRPITTILTWPGKQPPMPSGLSKTQVTAEADVPSNASRHLAQNPAHLALGKCTQCLRPDITCRTEGQAKCGEGCVVGRIEGHH